MTDNEIIKALERCQYGMPCERCPYDGLEFCRGDLAEDARNLINRQKAEIERLQGEVDKQYEIAEANVRAEIASGGTSCHWCEDKVRAEEIKGFAERLKEKQYLDGVYVVDVKEVDNLVKEMVGDTDG